MMQFDETFRRRVRWLTRRGLLELDILFDQFMRRHYEQLTDAELAVFVRLLDLPDQDILAWINQTEAPSDPTFLPLLEKIRHSGSS